MQQDNDCSATSEDSNPGVADTGEDATLQWLIEQEYAEEPEKLFALLEEEELDCSLTALEAEIAARPMTRGDRNLDDLSTYVAEEIVLGDAGNGSDIYARQVAEAAAPARGPADTPMTIDHARLKRERAAMEAVMLDDGADILGLSEEDDIGEQFLVIRKLPAAEAAAPVIETTPPASFAPAEDSPTISAPVGDTPAGDTQAVAGSDSEIDAIAAEQPAASGFLVEMAAQLGHDLARVEDDQQPAEEEQHALADIEFEVTRIPAREHPAGTELADVSAGDLADYVSGTRPPLDEEAFDQYLLQGEHLDDSKVAIEDLVVERTEGVASVDPTLEANIDYHEDFIQTIGLDGDSVSAITRVIGGAMEELSAAVAARLAALDLDPDCVRVETELGADPDSVAGCLDRGYAPVAGVCSTLPTALLDLTRAEVDAIHVRLRNLETGAAWNDLFREDFQVPGGDDDAGLPAAADLIKAAAAPGAADELAHCYPADDPDPGEVTALDDQDIAWLDEAGESATSDTAELDLGDEEDWVGFAEVNDPLERDEPSAEELACMSAEHSGDAAAAGREDVPAGMSEPVTSAAEQEQAALEESASGEPIPEIESESGDGFEEDIFGPDFADEFDTATESTADVDALFDSLAEPELEGDDICGLAVDEFSDAGESFDLQPTSEAILESDQAPVEARPADMSWCIPADIKFNFSGEGQGEIFTDFLDAFIEEAASELEKLEDAMSAWEAEVDSEPVYAPIPRILHTLKGIAKGVGLQRYGTLIHNYETLLEGLARPRPDQELDYFRIVHAWLDAAVSGFEHVRDTRADIESEFPTRGSTPPQLEQQEASANTGAADDSGAHPVAADGGEPAPASNVVPILDSADRGNSPKRKQNEKQIADEGAKVLAAKQSIRMTPEALDHLLNLASQAQQLGVRSSQATLRNKGAAAELQGRLSSVRSHIAKIADRALRNVTAKGTQSSEMDALEMDQYSELQEAANILREGVEDLDDLINHSMRQNAQVEAMLKQQASVISFLGSSIQAARVVPVSRLMPGLRRIVRTVSSDLGKAVQFRVLNEVGSLDRDNHARCQVILEHMVRNALDHGIESPAERIAAGKPTAGRISIDVNKQGGDYVIELADDGRGIDPDVMRETAFDKGLDVDVDALSDEEAQRLIFHKGFSTAAALSEISGRGVGMDIVISELQQIGGDIDIDSVVGEGTTFRVRIPSNQILNGALLVNAGRASYAIPLDGLIAVEHVAREDFYRAVENQETLSLFGMDCEPSYLATLCHGEGLPEHGTWGATVPVIIAGSDDRFMAIAIDDVKEALELVIRSLGVQFSMVPGVTGAATTSDGQAIVALDLNALVASLTLDEKSTVAVEQSTDETMMVLVVDDSRTQRLVATSRFDTLGVETVTAENGMVAMEFLNATHRLPDVVLLDVEMPVKDGIQTLRDIRASARLKDLPVIMVTSRTGAKHRSLAEEAGCNGYMGKPFNFPVLVEMISELTNRELQLA